MADALPPSSPLSGRESDYFDLDTSGTADASAPIPVPPSQRHGNVDFDFEDSGFEVFDPRGLFSPVGATASSLPFAGDRAASQQTIARDDAGPPRPSPTLFTKRSDRSALPPLHIPGKPDQVSIPPTASSEAVDSDTMDVDAGPSEVDDCAIASGAEDALADAPCQPDSRQANGSRPNPDASRSPPPSRGRDQLRRLILDSRSSSKVDGSPSPSRASGSIKIHESPSDHSISASMSASQVLHSSPGPAAGDSSPRRNGVQQGPRRHRLSSLLHRAETSPAAARMGCDDTDESIGSDAYSDMVSSPAVSFLSMFADSTNNSALGRSRSLRERGARSRVPSGATGLGDGDVDMKDAMDGSFYLSFGDLMAEEGDEDEEGDEVAGYVLGRQLGKGGFSVVREATETSTGAKVAVKIVHHPAPRSLLASGFLESRQPQNGRAVSQPLDMVAAQRDRAFSVPEPFDARAAGLAGAAPPNGKQNGNGHSRTRDQKTVEDYLSREIAVWSKLAPHPNVLPMLGVHRESGAEDGSFPGRGQRTYLFMPLCEGGNLLQLLNEHSSRARSASGSGSRPRDDRFPRLLGNGLRRFTEPLRGFGEPVITEDVVAAPSGGLDLSHARFIFGQIVKGLEHLHVEAGVTHRDLKLENVLVHEGVFRIADFGLASVVPSVAPLAGAGDARLAATPRIREASDPLAASWSGPEAREWKHVDRHHAATDGMMTSFAQAAARAGDADEDREGDETSGPGGSLPYTAPEQLRSRQAVTDHSIDVWALGCILYALLEGRLPFADDFEPRLRLLILRGTWTLPEVLERKKREAGREARAAEKVLRGCLEMDPAKRWSIVDVARSEWLTDGGDEVERGRRRSRSRRPLVKRWTSGSPSVTNDDASSPPRTRMSSRQSSVGSGGSGSRSRQPRRGRSGVRGMTLASSGELNSRDTSPVMTRSRRASEDVMGGGQGVERTGRSIHRDSAGPMESTSRSRSRRRAPFR